MSGTLLSEQKFSRADWFRLFLVCAFPLHLWTLLMAFRDINWVAERTTSWDALGFMGYAMFYTLIESALLFGFIALLSLLLPRTWKKSMRFVTLSLLAFVLAGWSIIEQLILIIFYGRLRQLGAVWPWLSNTSAPMWIAAALVTLSAVVPLLILHGRSKLQSGVEAVLERLTILSGLYLFLDGAGLIVILIRNLAG